MAKRPGEPVKATITVRNGDGGAVNPTTAPTCSLRRNSDPSTDIAATVTKGSNPTGQYSASSTIPSSWVAGDKWELIASIAADAPNGIEADSDVIDSGFLDLTEAQEAALVRTAVTAVSASATRRPMDGGKITIIRGDEYTEATAHGPLTWELTNAGSLPDMTGWSVFLILLSASDTGDPRTFWSVAGTIDVVTGATRSGQFEAENIASTLELGPGEYQIRFEDTSGNESTPIVGQLHISRQFTRTP